MTALTATESRLMEHGVRIAAEAGDLYGHARAIARANVHADTLAGLVVQVAREADAIAALSRAMAVDIARLRRLGNPGPQPAPPAPHTFRARHAQHQETP